MVVDGGVSGGWASTSIRNAFTVDVEDYYHVSAFGDRIRPADWDGFESRVVANTEKILRLLSRHNVRATFFVLGWVADRFPSLVRDIACEGHEIGCHSYSHRLVYEQTEEEFRADLRRALDALDRAAGVTAHAYRAPSFSLTERSLWALEILAEEGITLDSSIFPVRHDRYGIPGADRFPHRVELSGRTLVEFPPSVYRFGRVNMPVAGGGYFRLLPLRATSHAIRRTNAADRQPFMFYIHPWELDPEQPRLPGRLLSRIRHYQNLRSTAAKLDRLLSRFPFGSASDALHGRLLGDGTPLASRAAS
ncbi:MAG TPA: XrtA system polysaccharide deacetylase [Planctomycetaceae bacterium]